MNPRTRMLAVLSSSLRALAAAVALLLGCGLAGESAFAAGGPGSAAAAAVAGAVTVSIVPSGTGAETAATLRLTPAAQLVALNLREMTVATPAVQQRAARRMGMHVVVRIAVADMVSHPDSGDFDIVLRSRLLNRSIARAPLAVGVSWRF